MGKVDDLRALREARYSQRAKRIEGLMDKVPEERRAELSQRLREAKATPGEAVARADLLPEELCGHQSISKARCTRPKGHLEKNHRYK